MVRFRICRNFCAGTLARRSLQCNLLLIIDWCTMALLDFFSRFRRNKGSSDLDRRAYVHHVDDVPDDTPEDITALFPSLKNDEPAGAPKATIIVVGNEKGGSGKSTTCMHIIAGLLNAGKTVASFDLDARQGSLTRYIENRKTFFEKYQARLVLSTHMPVLFDTMAADNQQMRAHIRTNFEHHIQKLAKTHDFIVIDTPGTDNYLSRLGHSYADILVTPVNDSFIDLDVLAHVDSESLEIKETSHYTSMVLEQQEAKKRRYLSNDRFDWLVMRNRLGQMRSRNQEAVGEVLQKIGKDVGFTVFNGLSERVVYRELFLNGLTLLDIRESQDFNLSSSHSAARAELANLLERLNVGLDVDQMMKPSS